jgi:Na+/melibiose symporter-like transporter
MYAFISHESTILVAAFMILNRTIPQGAFYLFPLSLSDIVDHDNVTNNRPHSMSSTLFGLNALCTKPAQSIGPMIVFSILIRSGYAPQFVVHSFPVVVNSFPVVVLSLLVVVLSFLSILQHSPYSSLTAPR